MTSSGWSPRTPPDIQYWARHFKSKRCGFVLTTVRFDEGKLSWMWFPDTDEYVWRRYEAFEPCWEYYSWGESF